MSQVDLGDARLNKRLVKIVEALSAQPDASVPQASEDWAATKATYAFWRSERIRFEDIIEAHQISTLSRVKEHNLVLAIQDPSDFSFTDHPSKTPAKGFGAISTQSYVRGLKVHSILGISTQGVPLGLLHQQVWTREIKQKGKAKIRRQLQIR